MLTNPDRFVPGASFAALHPVFTITPQEIAAFMVEKLQSIFFSYFIDISKNSLNFATIMQEVRQNREGIKSYLMRQLRKERAFWSFDKVSCRDLSDRNLIVLIHLDLKDTDRLFDLYPKRLIKRVWRDELVLQGDYLLSMNLCYALLYFDAKRPLQYVKSLTTRHINQWKKR